MKILHVALASSFTDEMSYQENQLIKQNAIDGHSTTIISDCSQYIDGKITRTSEQNIILKNGVRSIKIKYDYILTQFISDKIRRTSILKYWLETIMPDVILFHGLCGWELLTVADYRHCHPNTRLYVDSHEDANNSATNFLSMHILHKLFYKWIIHRALPYIDRILYVSMDIRNFIKSVYNIPLEQTEFYPLGGEILTIAQHDHFREHRRKDLGLSQTDVLFIQTGKMGKSKKILQTITEFTTINDPRFFLLLIGSIEDNLNSEITTLISKNSKIIFIGWKTSDELTEYLCAADVYLQPGTQSATMQHSLCCNCAVVLDDVESHHVYVDNNGWLLNKNFTLRDAFLEIAINPEILANMKNKSRDIALRLLDYRLLAARLYS